MPKIVPFYSSTSADSNGIKISTFFSTNKLRYQALYLVPVRLSVHAVNTTTDCKRAVRVIPDIDASRNSLGNTKRTASSVSAPVGTVEHCNAQLVMGGDVGVVWLVY